MNADSLVTGFLQSAKLALSPNAPRFSDSVAGLMLMLKDDVALCQKLYEADALDDGTHKGNKNGLLDPGELDTFTPDELKKIEGAKQKLKDHRLNFKLKPHESLAGKRGGNSFQGGLFVPGDYHKIANALRAERSYDLANRVDAADLNNTSDLNVLEVENFTAEERISIAKAAMTAVIGPRAKPMSNAMGFGLSMAALTGAPALGALAGLIFGNPINSFFYYALGGLAGLGIPFLIMLAHKISQSLAQWKLDALK